MIHDFGGGAALFRAAQEALEGAVNVAMGRAWDDRPAQPETLRRRACEGCGNVVEIEDDGTYADHDAGFMRDCPHAGLRPGRTCHPLECD